MSIAAPASHNSPEQFAPWSSPLMTPVSERRESETRERAGTAQVGSLRPMNEPLSETIRQNSHGKLTAKGPTN
jgi:hypothetical protein